MPGGPDSARSALESFIKNHPKIKYVTPTDPEFAELGTVFVRSSPATPLAIVRPQNAEDVAALTSFCAANAIQFTIRSGGNSIYGLSCIQDALMIDMRDINYVKVDGSKSSATVGGGTIVSHLLRELKKDGLVTSTGSLGFLGFTAWSTYGGYGTMTSKYGLGVDNILAAKVVNAKGDIVVADRELLKGIRGAGGALGVIVELTIKVYPLTSVLAGMIIFDSQDIHATFTNFNVGYRALSESGSLPLELTLSQLVLNTPYGRTFAVPLVWASEDHDTGREVVAKIAALGTVAMNTVAPTTLADYIDYIETQVPSSAYGTCQTVSIRKLNTEASEVLGKAFEKMPGSFGTSLCAHELRGPSAVPNPDSVFASREPHFMLELISFVTKEEDAKESIEWANQVKRDILGTDSGNLLPNTYISLTGPEHSSLSKLYASGDSQDLVGLKKKHDPKNVFSTAVPKLVN